MGLDFTKLPIGTILYDRNNDKWEITKKRPDHTYSILIKRINGESRLYLTKEGYSNEALKIAFISTDPWIIQEASDQIPLDVNEVVFVSKDGGRSWEPVFFKEMRDGYLIDNNGRMFKCYRRDNPYLKSRLVVDNDSLKC